MQIMAEKKLESSQSNRFYGFATGVFLALLALGIICILTFTTIPLAIQQALMVVVGFMVFASWEAFKRIIGDVKPESFTFNQTVINDYRTFNDYRSVQLNNLSQNLPEAAEQIQQLLYQLKAKGYSEENAEQEIAIDLATQAQINPESKKKLLNWAESLTDAMVSDVVKKVVMLALRATGLP